MTPNPKSNQELLDLPIWEPYESVTLLTAEDVAKWQSMAECKLKIGHTLRIPNRQSFEPNPVDGDTVMFAKDEHGEFWVQCGQHRRHWP